MGSKIDVVSCSSEIQLEVGGKAGNLGLGKLDDDVRNAFKEMAIGRTWYYIFRLSKSVDYHMAEDEKAVGFKSASGYCALGRRF